MPQYADPSVLMQAKGINVPTPFELQGGAITLADLFTKQQTNQLNLEQMRTLISAMQDPEVMQWYTGGGTFAPPPGMTQKYGLAIPKLLESSLGIREKQASIGEKVAQTGKLERDVQDAALAKAGQLAANAAQNPSADLMLNVAMQLRRAGVSENDYGRMPSPNAASPQAMSTWLTNVATNAMTPKEQQDIAASRAKTPGEVAHVAAQTGDIPLHRFWDAYGKQTERAKAGLDVYTDESTGERRASTIFGAPGMPGPGGEPPLSAGGSSTQGSAQTGGTPVSTAMNPAPGAERPSGGTPAAMPKNQGLISGPDPTAGRGGGMTPQVPTVSLGRAKPSAVDTQLIGTIGKQAEDYMAQAQAAAPMKQMVVDLRNQEANGGIYSGGVYGTDYFKKIANVLAPMLSKESFDRLSNTQAWDAEAQTVVAQAVRQFAGSRVAARELDFFKAAKPNSLMTTEGREMVYRMLYRIADDTIQQSRQADEWLKTGHSSWLGFEPKFQPNPMPPIILNSPDGTEQVPVNSVMDAARVLQAWGRGVR